jgi:nitrogen fixation protein FixH
VAVRIRLIRRVLKKPAVEHSKEEVILRPTELLRTNIRYDEKIGRWEVTDFVPMGGNKSALKQHRRFYTRDDLLKHHPELKKIIRKHQKLKKHL